MTLARLFLLFAILTSFAQAEVYEPKPGSAERTAIMDAMRGPVSKHAGTKVKFTGAVKVSGQWARFQGNVASADGKPFKPKHVWSFPADKLRDFETDTSIGTGYRLALNWGADKPAGHSATVMARYLPKSGVAIESSSSTISLATK